MSDWTYNGAVYAPTADDLRKYAGFVYIIEEISTSRRYIGKKSFHSMRTVAGQKRRQRRESDWRKYFSSHKGLKAAAKANPADYTRTILHLCETAGKMTFLETAEQFKHDAIVSPAFLNDNIAGRFFRKTVEAYF